MATSSPNPPAFPTLWDENPTDESGKTQTVRYVTIGMSLRDYFAAKALAGFLASDYRVDADIYAQDAYIFADAMLNARNKL